MQGRSPPTRCLVIEADRFGPFNGEVLLVGSGYVQSCEQLRPQRFWYGLETEKGASDWLVVSKYEEYVAHLPHGSVECVEAAVDVEGQMSERPQMVWKIIT